MSSRHVFHIPSTRVNRLPHRTSVLFRPLASLCCLTLLAGCAAPSNVDQRIQDILANYSTKAGDIQEKNAGKSWNAKDLPSVPSTMSPWWGSDIQGKLLDAQSKQVLPLDELYVRALEHSNQIRVFSDIPLIRRTGVQEAIGAFDTNAFVETKYEKINDPIGSTLQTGSTSGRFEEESYTVRGGLRKKLITGTQIEATQEIGNKNNNSTFFIPSTQGNAELKLRITQPILKGAGIRYNEAIINIARLDSEIAQREFIRQTESHLLEITRSYWGLYQARSVLAQKRRLFERTSKIVEELEARKDYDALRSQLARSRSARAERKADLVRAELAVRNTQDRILALTNDPTLYELTEGELIPNEGPLLLPVDVSMTQAARIALENRPEITQAFLQLRAAAVREDTSRNELLPNLSFFVEGSLGGLAANGNYTRAFDKQYEEGGPGYAVGALLEFPLENNIANARLERRKIELRQQLYTVKTTIETVLLELKVSVREVQTAYRDVQAKYDSMVAADEELFDLDERRGLDAGSDEISTSAYLNTLLDSQQRLASSEEDFTKAAAVYNVALTNLERAKGTLLSYKDIQFEETTDERGLPVIKLEMAGRSERPMLLPTEPEKPAVEKQTTATPPADSGTLAKVETADPTTAVPVETASLTTVATESSPDPSPAPASVPPAPTPGATAAVETPTVIDIPAVTTPAPTPSGARWTTADAGSKQSASLAWFLIPALGAGALGYTFWRSRKK